MLNDDGLIWRTRFTNAIYLQNKLWPNDTEVSLHMTPVTNNAQEQHLAFDKIKYVFAKTLQNSLFVQSTEEQYNKFSNLDNCIVDFFDKPIDQIVGICLLSKLNAMTDEFLKINVVEIESWQGENLRFVISENSPEYDLLKDCKIEKPWWNNPLPVFSNFTKQSLTWSELGFIIENTNEKFKIIKGGT